MSKGEQGVKNQFKGLDLLSSPEPLKQLCHLFIHHKQLRQADEIHFENIPFIPLPNFKKSIFLIYMCNHSIIHFGLFFCGIVPLPPPLPVGFLLFYNYSFLAGLLRKSYWCFH